MSWQEHLRHAGFPNLLRMLAAVPACGMYILLWACASETACRARHQPFSLVAEKVQDKRTQHGRDPCSGFFYHSSSLQASSAANVAAPRGRAVPTSSSAAPQEWSQATAQRPSAGFGPLDCAQNWAGHAGPNQQMTAMAPSFEKPSHDWQAAEEPARNGGMPYVHSVPSMSERSVPSRPAPMRNDTPKVGAFIPCEGSDDSAAACSNSNSPNEVPPLPMLLGNLRSVEKPPKESMWRQEVNQQAHLFLPGARAGSETLGITDFEAKPEEAAELLGPDGFRRVEKLQWLQKRGRRYTKEAQAKKHLNVFHTLRWRPNWLRNYPVAEHYPLLVEQAVRIWAHQPLAATEVVPLNPGLATSVPELSIHHREHGRSSRQWKGTKRFAQTFAL
ncbi:unnamed protein product [Symbiodinium pilosum]|uniref:Uncharacterized protein n=1 Tax=Symbiodinium pilosum TaxID=2952 RepID=A0A812NIK2_SYMPI|nr:unnamed protein product [Symbiodinium pilosum]